MRLPLPPNARGLRCFLKRLELFRQLRIANFIGVEVGHATARAVFHLAGAKIVQERAPLFVFFQILGDVSGEKNVPGIAAIHHPLRHVEPSAGEISPFVYIDHATNRSAVDAHPQMQVRVLFEGAADLQGALRWLFRALVKNQCHAVAGWDFD